MGLPGVFDPVGRRRAPVARVIAFSLRQLHGDGGGALGLSPALMRTEAGWRIARLTMSSGHPRVTGHSAYCQKNS
jgi:hypothetical protein